MKKVIVNVILFFVVFLFLGAAIITNRAKNVDAQQLSTSSDAVVSYVDAEDIQGHPNSSGQKSLQEIARIVNDPSISPVSREDISTSANIAISNIPEISDLEKVAKELDPPVEISTVASELPDTRTVINEFLTGVRVSNGANVWAIVDISDQKAYIYHDSELIAETDVITGHSKKSPTPLGTYTVWLKRDHWYMRGDKNLWSDYGVFFNRGIAIHHASWRPSFGGDTYISNGSMGCVNTNSEFAELFWTIAIEKVTTVYVQE